MRSLLGRFHRPMSRGLVNSMLTMNNLGDGSTLSLDFTTMGNVLDPRLTFSRAGGGTYVGPDGYIYGIDSATSSSLAIGTGSKSVTLTATANVTRRFEVGQTVYFSSGANNMSGLVTAYDASTQVITINATATTGSGSFTSWFVGNASPRFDYSPTNIGEPRGLLIEGQAVNLCTYSQAIAGAGWTTTTGYTVTTNTTDLLSPAGDNTATKLVYTSGYARCIQIVTLAANTTYTMSYWIKSVGTHTFRVYDLTAGVDIASSIGSIPVTSSWTRVQKTFTTGASTSSCWFYVAADGGPTAGMTAYVWGAQLEAGSGASSYIPTGASQVTRNVDTCYMSGISSWYNESAGTVISNLTYSGLATVNSGIELSVGTGSSSTNRIGIRKDYVDYYSGGFNSAEMYPTVTSGNVRIGTAYSLNDFAMCSNGGTMRTDGSGAVPVGLNTLKLYADNGTSTLVINGLIRSIKYFPTRLPNDQLQTLTTP